MFKSGKILLTAIAFLVLSGCSSTPWVVISDPWARPSSAAAYFVSENFNASNRLLSVETALATDTQFHESQIDQEGIVRMEEQANIILPPNSTIVFEPGELHLMLIDLQSDLTVGERINLQFIFEDHEPIRVESEIRNQ